jgi:hypothetical protein
VKFVLRVAVYGVFYIVYNKTYKYMIVLYWNINLVIRKRIHDNRCSRETSEHDAMVFCGRWTEKQHEPRPQSATAHCDRKPHEPRPNRGVNLLLGSTASAVGCNVMNIRSLFYLEWISIYTVVYFVIDFPICLLKLIAITI